MSAQRTAKGPISITECCIDGDYIVIENTSKRNDVNMTNWVLTHCVGSVRKISFKFPENFILKSKQSVKLWAGNKTNGSCNSSTSGSTNSKYSKQSISTSSSQTSSSSSFSAKSTNINSSSNINGFYLNGNVINSSNGSVLLTNGNNNQKEISNITNGSCSGLVTSSNSTNSTNDLIFSENIENELIIYDIENWICGSQEIFIRLENEFGEEKASFKKTN